MIEGNKVGIEVIKTNGDDDIFANIKVRNYNYVRKKKNFLFRLL